MGPDAVRLKQLRFARSWASTKLHRVPQKLNKILAVSDFEREILQRQVPAGVTVETLFNPVDPASTERQNPSGSQTYLWIGRMTQEKDGITPAAVCHEKGLSLTFVGDGPLRADIQRANPEAKFLGWLGPAAVKQEQCKARALLMTSKWHETASLVVLECLAAGIPCVVPTTSAATNWIENGVNGLTFEAGNASSLGEALEKLKDNATVEAMSKQAFEKYWQAPFTEERYQTDLLRHYQEALEQ
jgi:glycosyltransferase involved in cell wall biosynthesis